MSYPLRLSTFHLNNATQRINYIMAILITKDLQVLRSDLHEYLESPDLTLDQKGKIYAALNKINLASTRIEFLEDSFSSDEDNELFVSIHEVVQNSPNVASNAYELASFITKADSALDYVLACVEPDEPWPKG
jgi:alpha-L-arabinofuranosidase